MITNAIEGVLVLMDGTKYAILTPLCNFVLSFEFFVVKNLTIKTLKQNTRGRRQETEDRRQKAEYRRQKTDRTQKTGEL